MTRSRTPSSPTRIFLVRHGETVWHTDNRYAGASSDIDLTERGTEQARALAVWSQRQAPVAVYSSPVRRAVETAHPSAQLLGLHLQQIDDLREVSFGVAEGRTIQELTETDPAAVQRFRADPAAHPFDGSEPPTDAAHRAAGAIREIARMTDHGSALVVGHNTLFRLALCELLGIPVSRYRTFLPRLDNGAVTELAVPTETDLLASLITLNVPLHSDR